MKVIVNHLTRMKPPNVCIAGLHAGKGVHVRPVGQRQLNRTLTAIEGGPFGIGAVVDLGATQACGNAPEVEDVRFAPSNAKLLRTMEPGDFWTMLEAVAKPSLQEIFGADLQRQRHSFAVDLGKGQASLGCWSPTMPIRLYVNEWDGISISLTMDGDRLYLPVTDLRLCEADQKTPRRDRVAQLSKRISKGIKAILSVGLAREYKVKGDTQERHWFQVNNVHLEDEPIW